MAEIRSFGIKKMMIGDIPDDGTMSIMLTQLPLTVGGTASLKEGAATFTDIYSEEEYYAVESLPGDPAQTVLSFSIMDYTPETLQLLKGGVLNVDGGWGASRDLELIEKAFQIITKKDLLIEIPRARVSAVINALLSKKGIDQVDVKGMLLLPDNPAVQPINIVKYQLPVVDAGADQGAVAAANANLAGTATPFRGTATYAWTCKTKPAAAAAPGITTPDALNTAVTGLVSGNYVFTLTVTDSNGYVNSDDVSLTVNIA
jgi:hypothetical protein